MRAASAAYGEVLRDFPEDAMARERVTIYRRDIANSPTPDERRAKLMDDYKARFANPYVAAERGYIDDVIVPHETRPKLIKALHMLLTKRAPGPRRKHGNIPL